MKRRNKRENRYFAYTDGSAREPEGMGGSAFIILDSRKKEIIYRWSEFFEMSTNNQMELIATIEAVEWFVNNVKGTESYLVVMSDSKYCVTGFNVWMDEWKDRNWRTTSNKRPKNSMLWRRLYDLKHDPELMSRVHFQWVKGHNGDQHNEIADDMARSVWKKEWNKIKSDKKKNE